jgi:hypothetical protein
VVHSPPGPWDMWQHQSSPLRKVEPRAVGHIAAPELTSSRRQGLELRDTWQRRSSPQQGGEVRGRGTLGSTGAHLSMEARSEAMGHVVAPEPTSTGRCGHMVAPELTSQEGRARSQGTRGSARAHLSTEARSWAAGHMVAPEPISAGRCGPKLQLTW